MLMLDRELHLPNQLEFISPPTKAQPLHEYVVEMLKKLEKMQTILQEEQVAI